MPRLTGASAWPRSPPPPASLRITFIGCSPPRSAPRPLST
jgi:hypothetical protein